MDKGWALIATSSPQGSVSYYTIGWKEDTDPIYPEFIKAWRNKELDSYLYEHFSTDEEMAYYFYSKFQEK